MELDAKARLEVFFLTRLRNEIDKIGRLCFRTFLNRIYIYIIDRPIPHIDIVQFIFEAVRIAYTVYSNTVSSFELLLSEVNQKRTIYSFISQTGSTKYRAISRSQLSQMPSFTLLKLPLPGLLRPDCALLFLR